MEKRNVTIGVGLILIGIAVFLKNFNILPGDTITLFAGIFFLYLYYSRKQHPFMVLGLVLTLIGAFSILKGFLKIDFEITGELFLIFLGSIFLFFYFTKRIQGLVFPGCILPALGISSFMINKFDNDQTWPILFIMLGLAFYAIYFIEYFGCSNWPLIPGTILIGLGVLFFLFSFNILDWNILKYSSLVWPTVLIIAGILMLFGAIRNRRT